MKREDLFEAIGGIEETRLAKTESREVVGSKRTVWRVMLAAAIIMSLATTAFAYVGFVVYDNPQAMLQAFFGKQPEPHGSDCRCAECRAAEPTMERVPVNMEVAQKEVAPYISEVGDTAQDKYMGYRITVDAHTYDAATGCGLIYYTMDRVGEKAQYPINYQLESTGEVWDIPGYISQPERSYLVQEGSTEYSLKIACYYTVMSADDEYVAIGFQGDEFNEDRTEVTGEWSDLLYLPLEDNGMKSLTLAQGDIVLSPIGLRIDAKNMDFLSRTYEDGTVSGPSTDRISRITICYADGSTYPVKGTDFDNYAYACGPEEESWCAYSLNRIVDVDNVTAVVINDVEFPIE